MKLTTFTLLALGMAIPTTFAIDLAEPLTISVESTLKSGSITVFPDGKPISVHHNDGERPQPIGTLYFTKLGKENAGRFDVIDTQQAEGFYEKCLIWILKDPKIDAFAIEVKGSLAHLDVVSALPKDMVQVECNTLKNGE